MSTPTIPISRSAASPPPPRAAKACSSIIEGRRNAGLAESSTPPPSFALPTSPRKVRPGIAVLVTKKPQAAFATIGRLMFPAAASPQALTGETGISPHAHVDPTARLEAGVDRRGGRRDRPVASRSARGTIVAPNAVIGRLCQIGRDCYVGPASVVQSR